MDWFDPDGEEGSAQARTLNYSLKMGGRILLRSASIEPWYIRQFEENGFSARRVGARFPGTCIDRYVQPTWHHAPNVMLMRTVSTCTRRLGYAPRPRRSNDFLQTEGSPRSRSMSPRETAWSISRFNRLVTCCDLKYFFILLFLHIVWLICGIIPWFCITLG